MPVTISAAVEGVADEAVVRKLIAHAGAEAGAVYGKNGKPHLKERIAGYNNAAKHAPWLVLVDLNGDADCAPVLRAAWLPAPARMLCFRVAVRAIEAWLIADATVLAQFMGVAGSKVPPNPDLLPAPKQALVNLARASRKRAIREDMVPREGSGRPVGPAYTSRLVEFATSHWQPGNAVRRSDSLRRAIACLQQLASSP